MRDLITIVEGASTAFLYHGTTSNNLRRMKQYGLIVMNRGSHWTPKPEIAAWFAKHKADDHGGEAVVLKAPFSMFEEENFRPDLNIIDFAIPAHEADADERFNGLADPVNPTWEETLRLYDSVIYASNLCLPGVKAARVK